MTMPNNKQNISWAKHLLISGAVLSLGYGILSHMVQPTRRAEEMLSSLIKERTAAGFVHEEIPKIQAEYSFIPGDSYHLRESDKSTLIFIVHPLSQPSKDAVSHEAGHAYVSERLRRLRPSWQKKYENIQLPDASLPVAKRASLHWDRIRKTEGLEELVSYTVVNEGIAMYFMLREAWYGHNGFTASDSYRKRFGIEDCGKNTKDFPRDLSMVCATNLGQVLVTPLIDRHGPKAVDVILLNLPTTRELYNPAEYQSRIAGILR